MTVTFAAKLVLGCSLAAALPWPAAAQEARGAAAPRPVAGEVPDEKGRTPSEIAADYQRQWASAAARQAREAEASERRRQAISVPSDTGDCLAYLRGEGKCLVTVGDLNRRLASDPRWAETIGDSGSRDARVLEVRAKLRAALLEERYREALAGDPGRAGRAAEEAWQANLAAIADAAGDARLRALFRKHAARFGPRREVQAEFLAASDSGFLDSVAACMADTARADGARDGEPAGKRAGEGAPNGCAAGPAVQWIKPKAGALPREWEKVSRTLRKDELSAVTRCRFGWFVAVATRVTVIPGKSYPEAKPLLAYMADLPDLPAGADDPARTGAPAIDGADPEGRDNPPVRAWLLPPAAYGKDGKPASPSWADTARLGAMRIRLSDLPAEAGCEARALLRKDSLALLRSPFGTWYFRAGKRLPAAPGRNGTPCVQEPKPAPPGPVDLAAEALAAKERDFKLAFLEGRAASGEAADSGSAGPPSLGRWIEENVALDDNALKRF